MTKQALTLDVIDSQAAFALPARETLLVNVIINNVLNNINIDIDVKNNKVAVQICAVVALLNAQLPGTDNDLTCTITQ